MTFKLIEYVIAVSEEGSFSRAAQRLFISQPALSQSIRKAEAEMGAALFMRDTHTVRLTAAGELLVREGRELLRQREDLKNRIAGLSAARKETIRFGISPFYSKYYLPVVLPYFSQYFPAVKLKIIEEISVELEQMVIGDQLDFCFVPLKPQNPRLTYEVIYMEEILLAVPPGHPVKMYATPSPTLPYIDLKHLEDEPFIALKPVQKFNSMSVSLCDQAGFKPRIVYETLNWDTVNTLVADGIGVGFVPDILPSRSLVNRRPDYYRMAGMDTLRPYAVAYKKGRTLSPLALQLVEVFRNNIPQLHQ